MTGQVEDRAASLGIALPRGGGRLLLVLAQLLQERGVRVGVISPADAERILERHVLDCLRAVVALEPSDETAYDLGSGGGLPGLVVAIARPSLQVGLVEASRRRVAFLELAVEELELKNATIVPGRIERLSQSVDACFARALAPLSRSWQLAMPLLRPGGRLVYFAGERFRGPVAQPGAHNVRVLEAPLLERAGPLVIMTR